MKYKILLKKVSWITLAWLAIALGQFAYEYLTLKSLGWNAIDYSIKLSLIRSLTAVFLAGIIGGTIVVTVMTSWIRNEPYGLALLYILLSFTLIYFFVSIMAGLILSSISLQLVIYSNQVWSNVFGHLLGLDTLKNYIFWLVVILATNIVLLVSDKYGPGVFSDFLLGRYFHPQREQRIFMFLDIRSSTQIAEKLGEEKYFNFLKDFFKDATPPVIYTQGEIYQYVGDEMVVSWRIHEGRKNANCIRCFYDIKRHILSKSVEYQNNYGFIPDFKAGLHSGQVMAGEIGVIKRDIVFSGEVLNTASRIQEQCNQLDVDLLLSQNLLDALSLAPDTYNFKKVGNIELKGKEYKVPLFTI